MRSHRLVAALAAVALACHGSPGEPPGPAIASFTASPSVATPGVPVVLRPVFGGGVGRIWPMVGQVESGGTYEVGPFAGNVRFELHVEAGDARASAEVLVPFGYRHRLADAPAAPSARSAHGAVRLSDGRVLLYGGESPGTTFWQTAELFDPATGAFTPTGDLTTERARSPGVRVGLAEVLVAGGESNSGLAADRIEVWSGEAGAWEVRGALTVERTGHTLTALETGEVLVLGGEFLGASPGSRATEELVDPDTGATRAPRGSGMVQGRFGHTATFLGDGRVLVVGGWNAFSGVAAIEAELFEPAGETFAYAGALATPRGAHRAVPLRDGRVLVVGGLGDVLPVPEAEVWDPATGLFTPAGTLVVPRMDPEAVELATGEVLVVGGYDGEGKALADVETWDPGTRAFTWRASLPSPRAGHALVRLDDARVLVHGGAGSDGFPVPAVDLYE
jgi:hypothetical protein